MFNKLSKFRSSKVSSNSGVPQREFSDSYGYGNKSSGKAPNPPTPQSPQTPQRPQRPQTPQTPPTPPRPAQILNPLPSSKDVQKASLPVVEAYPHEDFDDYESNISFAESFFPITPVYEGRIQKKSSLSNTPDGSPFHSTETMKSKSPYESKRIDSARNWESQDLHSDRRPKSPLSENKKLEGVRNWDSSSKNSWGSDDVDSPRNSDLGGKRSWTKSELEGTRLESKKSWEVNSRKNWLPDGLVGNSRSGTSSSVPEEEIDIGPAVLPPYDDAEEDFLEEYEDYFENIGVDNVRKEQYPKLDQQRLVYLDYANFSLYSRYQVEEHVRVMLEEGPCLGSVSTSSPTSDLFMHVGETQDRLLSIFNTNRNDYSVVFTTGFQASYHVVAESYPFHKGSPLLVCQDNHDSVRQVMQSAYRHGGKPMLAPVTDRELTLNSHELRKLLRRQAGRSISNGGLFIYPAQSNLSGIKHSLNWIAEAQQNGWHVCIDTTTLLPTGNVDLMGHQPDFVVGSFHHMVGYPSGLGFLLVKRDSFCVQASTSHTVELVANRPASEGEDCHIVSPPDNTMNLLQFAALDFGLKHLENIGLGVIQKRVNALAQWVVLRLRTLRHKDAHASYLVRVYGSHKVQDRGSIITFNVMDSTGVILPPRIVKKLAEKLNITVSIGSFGNPGLANALGMADERLYDVNMIDRNWRFMAVRVSLGVVSNFSDAYRLVEFLSRFRDEEYLSTEAMGFIEERIQQ